MRAILMVAIVSMLFVGIFTVLLLVALGILLSRPARPRVIYAGIYSPKYDDRFARLRAQLRSAGVTDRDIRFERVPQSIFRVRKNCRWCGKQRCSFAFHHGEDCKIKHQLGLYKQLRGQRVVVVYVDTDVQLLSLRNWTSMLQDVDLVFEQEARVASKRWPANVNIGFTLAYPTDRVIAFYERVLHTLQKKKPPLNWDQVVVNHELLRGDMRYHLAPMGNTGFAHEKAGGA